MQKILIIGYVGRDPDRCAIFPSPVPIAGKTKMANSRKGRERTESWEDKKTGGMNYRDLVYVDRIEFLVLEVMAIAVRGRTNAEASETQF